MALEARIAERPADVGSVCYYTMRTMQKFLQPSKHIDFNDPDVAEKAAQLAVGATSESELAKRCFEFVRDQILHSWDFKRNPVTVKASEVLHHGTGYCYAKAHLLAALLRANNIPSGLCYQRLSIGESGAPYCLHGLNAVFLNQHGWYRIDARGNKPGVLAQFCPPKEMLAFSIREQQECDLPEIWSEPLPAVVETLEKYRDVAMLVENLPDVEVLSTT